MLKYEVNEVPEGLETYYTKTDDGKFRLQVEGVVSQAQFDEQKNKVKEFRDKNTELLKDNTSLNSFKDVLGGSGNLTPEGINKKIEELANSRAETLIKDLKTKHQDEVNTLTTDLNGKKSKLNSLTLTEQVRKAGPKHGVLDSAYDDVMYRAERDWEIGDDGSMKLKTAKLNSDGKAITTLEDWVADTVKAAPHLAKPSQGTGAGNGIRSKANPATPGESERAVGLKAIAAGLSANGGSKTPPLN